jgi:hypothetical protein
MRVMAGGAIFHHRRMLIEERAAPFGMTLVAGLVDRALDQQLGIGGSVRVMAIRTGNLSFPKRHVSRAINLRAAL